MPKFPTGRSRRVWHCALFMLLSLGAALSVPHLATPATVPSGGAAGLLESNTLFTVYGRAFGVAPILGKLGSYSGFDQMAQDTAHWVKDINADNGGKHVVEAVHLIYALAKPCGGKGDCLIYLEGAVPGIVKTYIEPAAARGWVVVLDTQLGRSDPVTQVRRMIDKGYLKYDNVHVAIDPEFHVRPGHEIPGIPIGTVPASQINEVQRILDDYVRTEHLKTKKILIVHQFGDALIRDGVPVMIEDKSSLRDYPNVELVITMDGLGTPAMKVHKYNVETSDHNYPFVRFRGIKVFYPNKWEHHGHYDKPPMTMDEVFGLKPVPGRLRMNAKPDVLIIA